MSCVEKNSQIRAYCFTLNNYTPEQYAAFKQKVPSVCKYAIVGEETGDEKETEHLQGYVQLSARKYFNAIKKWWSEEILAAPHIEATKGTPTQNFTYCSKQGKFWEHGDRPKQGKRTDIEGFLNAVESEKTDTELIKDFPVEWCKYYKAADRARAAFKKEKAIRGLEIVYKNVQLHEWQTNVIKHLKDQTHRQITWVFDQKGNKGKSFLAMYLCSLGSCYYVDGGKKGDIAYGYKDEDLVIFDYSRKQEKAIHYALMESFKNGAFFSQKYESGSKFFGPTKILVLSNFNPDKTAFSEDRWDIIDLSYLDNEKARESVPNPLQCSHNNCNEALCFCECHNN